MAVNRKASIEKIVKERENRQLPNSEKEKHELYANLDRKSKWKAQS